jgi:hypothetical protein
MADRRRRRPRTGTRWSRRVADREIRDDASSLSQENIRDYPRYRSPSQRSIVRRLAREQVGRVAMSMNVIDEEDEVEIDPHDTDNPPRRDGFTRTTMGFELEFLLAVTPVGGGPDPHPGDGRWTCPALADISIDSSLYEYTVSNRIIDELRNGNVVAKKWDNVCTLTAFLWPLPFQFVFCRLRTRCLCSKRII